MFNAVQQALQWHGFLARGGQIVDAILVLVVSAVCSNAKGWEAIEDFGHAKLDGLHQYLPLANGVPSHDCIEYVMTGVFQDSCRKNHAAPLTFSRAGLSGLRVTAAIGVQFRVLPDQRSGCLAWAAA